MAKALLILTNGRTRVIEPEQAVHYWELLHGRGEPTEDEAKKLIHIRHISIPPSYRPSDYEPIESWHGGVKPVTELETRLEDELENGVLQGMSEIIPRGDR